MRVLLVTRGFPPRVGGVERVCAELAAGLADAGDDVTVLTFAGRRPGPAGGAEPGRAPYRVLRLPSLGDTFEFSPGLVRELRRQPFDVCHVHNLHATVAAAVWRAGATPYVLTTHYHGRGHTAAARLLHPLYRRLAARIVHDAAQLTAVSATEADLVERDFGVRPVVIPNGVASERFAALPRRPDPDGHGRLVVVSRLVGYKRVDAALAALAGLPERWVLDVVGDGPDRARLTALAATLGVAGRVRFHGGATTDQQVRQLVRDADVLLNLSEAEAFSLVVLEALAAGTPVVVSGASTLRQWAARFPGAVVAADGPEAAAEAVATLDGRRAQVDLDEYEWPGVVASYRDLYAQVAGREAGQGAGGRVAT
jgi:glycosyltransferase involved in cell wall biosynthesis